MVNKLYILLPIFLSQIISSEWYFNDNDFWEDNTCSRSSALGGINLNKFPSLAQNQNNSNEMRIYNSSMYDGIIDYNNIFYSYKINNSNSLLSYIHRINMTLFNRKIDDIIGTSNIWSDEINPPYNSDEIDNSLINYYKHNDFSFLAEFFFENDLGNFGLHCMPSFSKIDNYSSKSISLDISYSKKWNNFFLGVILNNIFAYKKWDNQNVDRFYPSASFLVNTNFKKIGYFLEIDNFYFNMNNKFEDKFKLGIEYKLYSKANIRFGYNSNSLSVGLGANIYDKILFDYAYLNHPELGSSNQITLIFLLQRNNRKQ